MARSVANQPPPFQGRRPSALGDGKSWEVLGMLAEGDTVAKSVHEERTFNDGNGRPLTTKTASFRPEFSTQPAAAPLMESAAPSLVSNTGSLKGWPVCAQS